MFLYHSFIAYINDRCRCGFVRDRLSDEVFQCFDSSPQTVTYRAVLHGTASATSSELIGAILGDTSVVPRPRPRREFGLLARTYGLWSFNRVNIAPALAARAHAHNCHFTNHDTTTGY